MCGCMKEDVTITITIRTVGHGEEVIFKIFSFIFTLPQSFWWKYSALEILISCNATAISSN